VGRHDLQNEAECEENSAAPPTGRGQKIPRLPDSDERIGGRTGSAKVGGESGTFSALQEDRKYQDYAVQYEY
jgi:hypothetical protein